VNNETYNSIMNRLKTALLLTVTTLALFSCRRDEIHGSGHIITQDRSVPAFENVLIQGIIKANTRYGTSQHVTVRTDAVAIANVHTTVSNNTLVLDLDNTTTSITSTLKWTWSCRSSIA